MPPAVVVIDAVIAAGKTELLNSMTDRLKQFGVNVCAIPEPVEEWKLILPQFYQDPIRWAYSTQTFIIATRILSHQQSGEGESQSRRIPP